MNQQMQTAPGTAAQPPAQLKTNRSLLKFILLSLITFGIYGIVVMSSISNDIKTMPNYFSDYDTTVHFISEEELKRDHSGIPHGGFVIRSGKTGWNDENNHVIEYSLKLDSNPEFTSSVLVAYARAAYRMNKEGQSGAKTVFDVAPAYLCAADGAELRKHLL